MSIVVLYRWRITEGREAEFRAAWVEGTKLIHARCGSYGARLHEAADSTFWSYAHWPTEESRQACFAVNDFFALPCFICMQACIEERFDEVVLSPTDDLLAEQAGTRHAVPKLRTDRLVLRALRLEDAEALHPALSDATNMQMWSRGPLGSVDETRAYIAGNVLPVGRRCWGIHRQSAPNDALGWVVLMDRKPGVCEIGFILRPDAHGAGIAREAVGAVMSHAFEKGDVRRIYADTDPENAASVRLLEALGFLREGVLRGEWETHIGIRDTVIYGMLRPSKEA